MRKPALHILGLPHTETTRKYLHCAYTQKVRKFCDMMTARGFEVFLYAGEENEAACAAHVPLIMRREREQWFGEWDPNGLFGNVDWSPDSTPWRVMNSRAVEAIREHISKGDFILPVMGFSQAPVAAAFADRTIACEWAVGYEGIALKHRVFESYAWMHHVYGLRGIKDGAAFDHVIPNFFEPADFAGWTRQGDYLLFVGRVVARKGPHVAAAIAKRLDMKLVIAGPGVTHTEPGKIVAPEITIEGEHVEYVGSVDETQRSELMRNAACTIVPTQYIEPFGGVAVEAMMSGCPVVTTDWGAFTEYVHPTYRFRTLSEGCYAVQRAMSLDRSAVRESAIERFSTFTVGRYFEYHFTRLSSLWGDGWYA